MKHPYVLITAGGSGTRLWPLSRKKYPKQLLPILSKKSLLQETLDRALFITIKKNIFIGTNQKLKKMIQKEVPYLKNKQFIIEPEMRNTAPIIALFVAWLKKKKKNIKNPIIVLAADHYISPCSNWANLVESVFPFLEKHIFCVGIQPSRPEVGYGYIEMGDELGGSKEHHRKAIAFREKPNLATAKQYMKGDHFCWNSGIFIFSGETFSKELSIHAPDIFALARKCTQGKSKLKKNFCKMPNLSIDYALMEKTKKLAVAQGDFHWDDVGNFLSLERVHKKDANRNVVNTKCDVHYIGSKNNIVLTNDKNLKVALLGVEDLVIVEKNNVLLIAKKSSIDNIKKIREKFPDDS